MQPGPPRPSKPPSERSESKAAPFDSQRDQGEAQPLVLNQMRLRTVAASDRETLLQGRRAFERRDDAIALECLGRLANKGHEYADVYYMMGMIQERQGQLDAAIHSLRRATRINPRYVEALLALASLHERRGDYDISRGYAERASEGAGAMGGGLDATTRGKLANQQAALADALAEAGEKRDAIEQYRRALDRCPDFHDVRHRLGLVLREAGLPFQAAQEFKRVLERHPDMLDSQIQLGLTYYSLGRTPDAALEWQKVIERDPRRDDARMYLRLVGAAGEADATGSPLEGWAKRAMRSGTESAGTSPASTRAPSEPAPAREHSALEAELEAGFEAGDALLDFIEIDALERLEGIPMPTPDDLFKD